MNSFNKPNLKTLRPKVQSALELLEKELGIKFELGNCSFSSLEATFKLKVSIDSEYSNQANIDRVNELGMRKFKFESIYGHKFHAHGIEYKIIDVKTNSPKFPIVAENPLGKAFKFTRTILNQ